MQLENVYDLNWCVVFYFLNKSIVTNVSNFQTDFIIFKFEKLRIQSHDEVVDFTYLAGEMHVHINS